MTILLIGPPHQTGDEIMINAKNELMDFLFSVESIPIAMDIRLNADIHGDEKRACIAWRRGSLHPIREVLDQLDLEYDESFGSQILFGTVWFEDGTWAFRGEYDGSEWWEHIRCPTIPGVVQ